MSISKSVKAFWDRFDAKTIAFFERFSNKLVDMLPLTSDEEKEEIRPIYLGIVLPIIKGIVKGSRLAVSVMVPIFIVLLILWYLMPRWGFESIVVMHLFGIALVLGKILDKMP